LRGQRRNFTCFPILRGIDRRGTFERADYIASAGRFPHVSAADGMASARRGKFATADRSH